MDSTAKILIEKLDFTKAALSSYKKYYLNKERTFRDFLIESYPDKTVSFLSEIFKIITKQHCTVKIPLSYISNSANVMMTELNDHGYICDQDPVTGSIQIIIS